MTDGQPQQRRRRLNFSGVNAGSVFFRQHGALGAQSSDGSWTKLYFGAGSELPARRFTGELAYDFLIQVRIYSFCICFPSTYIVDDPERDIVVVL
jgi:hypothetical protein